MNRSIQVEGAFGVLKNDYEFQRKGLLKYAKNSEGIQKQRISSGFFCNIEREYRPVI